MNEPEALYEEPKRLWNAENTEEYVLSVCLHNKQALAKAMNSLYSLRDFKDVANRKAFSVIENLYDSGEEIDPIVVCDTWIDMDIYEKHDARRIAGTWNGDAEYEPKINQLALQGGIRKAKKDIGKLFDKTNQNTTPEELAQLAFDYAVSWNSGSQKKYYTAREVHEMKDERGEKLNLGIPLFDDTVYKHAGLHKGTVKASIFRSKHGKTRSACWELAQHLRQGRTAMYFTLEGQNNDILGNVKQILKDEWREYQENFLLVDDRFDIESIRSSFIEAEFTQGVDVVFIDYLQEVMLNADRWVGENERINEVCRQLTQVCTKYNVLMNLLSQVTTTSKSDRGYSHVPNVGDAYGSKQIIKAASMIMVGFRPKNYEELLKDTPMPPFKTKVIAPDESLAPIQSVFIKPALSRKKLSCQHQWAHFVDTDDGLKLHKQELI